MRREAGHTPDGHTSRSGVPSQPAGVARADRDAAFIDNVSRHLRHHPQAQVYDDQGRLRPPSREEADRIARWRYGRPPSGSPRSRRPTTRSR